MSLLQLPRSQQPEPKPGNLSGNEMRDHMAKGRSILISPVIEMRKNEDGEREIRVIKAGAHISHPAQIAAATTDLNDPVQREEARARARTKADRAVQELAEIDRIEGEQKPPRDVEKEAAFAKAKAEAEAKEKNSKNGK